MISLPKPLKIVEEKDNRAVFQIEALYPGYGVTIGNALRRVLLSSLHGAAVTEMKVKGVHHEFSTIPNIIEDVIGIMLNLKQLRFKIFTEEPQTAQLKIKGERTVKASDFKFPSQVELINKNSHIATITSKNAELDIEIKIEGGFGYQTVEQRKKEKLEIGVIAIDAIFTPIRNINFRVENMRVGERTDFDRLFLEVETDGTITPKQAFLNATKIFIEHLSLFVSALGGEEKAVDRKKTTAKSSVSSVPTSAPALSKAVSGRESAANKEDISSLKVEDLKFSNRTLNALIKNNIKSVGGLSKKSEEFLLKLGGMGETSIKEIKKVLKKFGMELK